MKLIDAKGRLFGKISVLDVGAGLILLLVFLSLFIFPNTSVTKSIAQTATKPIEVDVIVRGLSVKDSEALFQQFETEKTNIVIRKQPAGEAEIINIDRLPRTIPVPQPDGSVKALPDPRPEVAYSVDMILTLAGQAQVTDTGPVLGGQKVKVGTLIELEGAEYNFNTSTIDVRVE
ncbi:MAG: DUF4330 domain-containing protein [Microcystaceae cyanobacterium]